jgi:hypothetical protein
MLDYLGIFRELNELGIRYIVAGGMAVNFHGVPRMTYDIDLILDLENENLSKFLVKVQSWGFEPKMPVDIMDLADAEKRGDWIENKHMKAFNLVNTSWAISEIDILIDTPVAYKDAVKKVVHYKLDGIVIPTVSIEHLITMKRHAGREQDKADVLYLEKIMENED